jgi:hypothetical protein
MGVNLKELELAVFWKNFSGVDLDCKTIRHLLDQLEGLQIYIISE